ncbi:hypothetical protein ACFQ4P_03925 [Lacticaseibacillus mingshuiensis]|uniref:Uncharacterized protein n=1 Tax=Lacticaseibacillus mingshuiensis TaxID=2799574 RepID=A0ABW4CHE8_9LACO
MLVRKRRLFLILTTFIDEEEIVCLFSVRPRGCERLADGGGALLRRNFILSGRSVNKSGTAGQLVSFSNGKGTGFFQHPEGGKYGF